MGCRYLEQVRRIADRVMVMENGRLLPQPAA
jgi:ABC-type methionine transport system ATPase subunit